MISLYSVVIFCLKYKDFMDSLFSVSNTVLLKLKHLKTDRRKVNYKDIEMNQYWKQMKAIHCRLSLDLHVYILEISMLRPSLPGTSFNPLFGGFFFPSEAPRPSGHATERAGKCVDARTLFQSTRVCRAETPIGDGSEIKRDSRGGQRAEGKDAEDRGSCRRRSDRGGETLRPVAWQHITRCRGITQRREHEEE